MSAKTYSRTYPSGDGETGWDAPKKALLCSKKLLPLQRDQQKEKASKA
jgi:hypothetical protein